MLLRRWSAVLIVAVVATAACGGDDTTSATMSPVLATTSIWADIASNVACGAEIPALIPPGADPHSFEPSLRDRERLERATTVIANGLDLEEPLVDLLATAADDDVVVVEMSIHVDVLVADREHDEEHDDGEHDDGHADEHDDGEHDDGHDDEHGHGADGDPHIWQDPRRVAGALDVIGDAVAANDLPSCTDAYRDELLALDAEIETMLADLSSASRVMVTSHDSLAYFADRYDIEIVGSVIPATNTLAETNAADLAALADEIERRNVPAIFTDEMASTSDADALAQRLGVQVVPLITDALGDDPDTETYVAMMRHNATLIAEALAP